MEVAMTMTDKDLIKKQFSRGIYTYNEAATVQKDICALLTQLLQKHHKGNFNKILEIGCGTGFLTDQLINHFLPFSYMANDIIGASHESVNAIAKAYDFHTMSFLEGDGELIDYPRNIDLIASASAIQWFESFSHFVEKSYYALNQDGMLALATFGPDNYIEIKETLDTGLDYLTLEEHIAQLSPYFEILEAKEFTQQMTFEKPVDVLRHIKAIGANGIQKAFWGRQKLAEFENLYQQKFKGEKGVTLTYHPIIIIAKKK